jgi:colanic acid biosynthesis glycosyl transferase WcaI
VRVLAVNQFYYPDVSATSQLLTELCEDLVGLGDEVTVVASRGAYLGGGRLPPREVVRGVEVLRPWATSLGKRTIAHRMSDYLSFWGSSVGQALVARKPDVILSLTTPPMIAAGAALVSRLRGVPLVAWVQDVYPELAIAFEVLSAGHPAVPVLRGMNALANGQAAYSVALSDGMARRLEAQGQEPARIRVIHNWADGQAVRPVTADENAFRREHGLGSRFVAMYSGNLGVGHDVETLMEAARLLAVQAPEVMVVFVGDGARRAEAEGLAVGLGNVRFLPYQPRERLAESLSAADVHLASLRDGLEGLLVPSKLYGVLAAGRPLFYVGPATCEVSEVIRRAQIGWEGRPGDAAGLAAAVARAAADPSQTRAQGERARGELERVYDRRHATRRWRDLLAEASMG